MTLIRIPAPVDPHVHLRGMSWAYKGTFASETAAALAGGYAAVLDMPNTPPATVTPDALQYKREAIAREAVCDWGVYYGASQQGDDVLDNTVFTNACGLKIYCNETTGDLLVNEQARRAWYYARWRGSPIAVHAEGETVLDVLALVRQYHIPTHFCHISTAEEINFLRVAKSEGLPISVGVTPHHLWLTEADGQTLGAFGRMKPSLKTAADRDSLWAAIEDGTVDVVESDHAPHTAAEKLEDPAPYGVPGLETTMPLLLTAVSEGRLTVERLLNLVSTAPRRIFGLHFSEDTYTEVETDFAATIEGSNLYTGCGWTPFEGVQVTGQVVRTVIRGTVAYDRTEEMPDQISVPPGFGLPVVQTKRS